MKAIRKSLHCSEVRLTNHALKQMDKRGYTKKDLLCCIWMGERTELQFHRSQYKAVIEGVDSDGLPITCIVCIDGKDKRYLAIITVFPPIKNKFKRVI